MAKYKILHLNRMTCGNRRGLVDMDIALVDMTKRDLLLLPGTNLSGLEEFEGHRDAGIMTELSDYSYANTEIIYNYQHEDQKQPLSKEDYSSYPISDDVSCYVLNETQVVINSDSVMSGGHAVQLTPEEWILNDGAKSDDVDEFNINMSHIRVVYEFELDKKRNQKAYLSGDNSSFLPLNDILDVCVKSMFKKGQLNYNIPGDLLLKDNAMPRNDNVDQYFVFDDTPIGICQFGNDALVLSQGMTKQPYRLNTTLKDLIGNDNYDSAYTYNLKQDEIKTVLYKTPKDYGYYYTNFYEYLKSNLTNIEEENISKMFIPKHKISGISYNYIVNVEQNKNSNSQFDNPTIYDNGDIYGSFMLGKNMYNALYSMQMSAQNQINNCREYIGIQNAGQYIMLKYYDNCDYKLYFDSNGSDEAYAMIQTQEDKEDSSQKFPYQKVEMYIPIKFSQQTRHKSNVFSVKLRQTGLDEEALESSNKQMSDTTAKLIENIKKDISNGIRSLADAIVPANTQFFAAYFTQVST